MASAKATRPEPAGGLPKSTMIASVGVILFAGVATYMILQWSGSRSHTAALRVELAEATALEVQVHSELDPLEAELASTHGRTDQLNPGKLTFCNQTNRPITITMLAATWLDANEEFQTFSSEAFGRDLFRVGAKERQVLSFARGNWDGSVTYYALWVRTGSGEYPLAGTWPSDPSHCLNWTTD
jgi:hypothetical protein